MHRKFMRSCTFFRFFAEKDVRIGRVDEDGQLLRKSYANAVAVGEEEAHPPTATNLFSQSVRLLSKGFAARLYNYSTFFPPLLKLSSP